MYLSSQCTSGDLQPELYRAGSAALEMGVEGGPQMTAEVHPSPCLYERLAVAAGHSRKFGLCLKT